MFLNHLVDLGEELIFEFLGFKSQTKTKKRVTKDCV